MTTDADLLAAQVPSAWQVYIPILAGFARGLMQLLGSAGFTWALTVNASQIQMAVSAALALTGFVWSAIQKVEAARALNVAAGNPKNAPTPTLPA